MPAKYWTCRKCAHRNDRLLVKCRGEGCDGRRPKRPVRAHQRALTDNSYSVYVQFARDVHGVTDESCCVCGKPRAQERHHDRDHDHRTGQIRGLACGGNRGCNVLMLPWITWDVATAIAHAKEQAGALDWERWFQIAEYLQRIHFHYAGQE